MIKLKYMTMTETSPRKHSPTIKENGVIDPIIVSVRSSSRNKYQIITGRRRLYYANLHGLKEIQCIVWKKLSESDKSLTKFVQIVHKQKHTDDEKAQDKAAVYKTIGIPPHKSIQLVESIHWKEYTEKKA